MLKMDLCVLLGKTQAELLEGLSQEDMVEWLAYRSIKPFGFDVENKRVGSICAAIYNSAGKSFKKDFSWDDFFQPSFKEDARPKGASVQTLISMIKGLAENPERVNNMLGNKTIKRRNQRK